MYVVTRRVSPPRARSERPLHALLVALWVLLIVPASGLAEDLPAAVPSPTPEQPLTDSVDRIVKKVEEEREAACKKAKEQGVPCFPVTVEKSARQTLEEAIARLKQDQEPYKGGVGPSPLDLNRPRQVNHELYGASFDPVCAVKNLAQSFKGEDRTYYIYRIHDRQGDRVEMRVRPLDPQDYVRVVPFEMELLGEHKDVCKALAVHNQALRELRDQERKRQREQELKDELQREREVEVEIP